jgi:hypothetical protein
MLHYNVLFLCTGNSARSIIAESIMNCKGRGNFTVFSAGSHPTGAVRPEAIHQLEMAGALPATAPCPGTTIVLSVTFAIFDSAARIWPPMLPPGA